MKLFGKDIPDMYVYVAIAVVILVVIIAIYFSTKKTSYTPASTPVTPVTPAPAASSSTPAGSFISGGAITLSKSSGYLEIGQILAFDEFGHVLTPVSVTGTAQLAGQGGPVSSVIDGNLSKTGTDIFMTGDATSGAANSRGVIVVYGGVVNISKIILYLRTDCCTNMMVGAVVRILDGSVNNVLFTSYPIPLASAPNATNTAENTALYADPGSNLLGGKTKFVITIPNPLPVASS
jgi:hypothetical protein